MVLGNVGMGACPTSAQGSLEGALANFLMRAARGEKLCRVEIGQAVDFAHAERRDPVDYGFCAERRNSERKLLRGGPRQAFLAWRALGCLLVETWSRRDWVGPAGDGENNLQNFMRLCERLLSDARDSGDSEHAERLEAKIASAKGKLEAMQSGKKDRTGHYRKIMDRILLCKSPEDFGHLAAFFGADYTPPPPRPPMPDYENEVRVKFPDGHEEVMTWGEAEEIGAKIPEGHRTK